ncbi:MAG: 2-oxo acid dehydrogenase subunit E2 [Pirellulales bacterium]|nr:2-oxo acid dehydrogenase subunit E2 [Pirellulales bacterium]
MRTHRRTPISPRARRALRERGLDASSIRGTGPDGRIVEADVLRAAALPRPTAAQAPPAGSISSMRRAVAAKVAESFATVPHFYLRSEADVTALVQLRAWVGEAIQRACGQRPSLTDFILRAMILALADCPQANRIWRNDAIVELPTIDVGLVVQLDDGLLVPILREADRLGMIELVQRRAAAVEAVRSGRASADLFAGGATSLSNLGKRRVDQFSPIISPPQSSMLATGRVAERPAAYQGRLCLRQTIHLTLAADHRVMDGVPAAAFLDRVVELLEEPSSLLGDVPPPSA